MTKADKPVSRESYSIVRERGKLREVVVTIHPTWIGLRLKGTRKVFQLDINAAYNRAAWAEAEKARAEKKAAKALKKKLGGRVRIK
jgi:hypothetical protein